MTQIVGTSGRFWKESDFDERENRYVAQEKAKEQRRIMTARLQNWGAWYQREHKSEIDRASGQIKENLLSRLRKLAVGSKRDDDYQEIDDEDAIAIYEAVKMLGKVDHVAVLQYRFLDRYEINEIAEAAEWSPKTVKRRQQEAIDLLIEVL